MDVWQLVLVGLVMLLGLLSVLVPGAPGPAILWAAVVWWALSDRSTSAWVVLLAATALLLLNVALRSLLPSRRRAAPRQSLAMGGVAAMVGFFVLPVVGGVAGFVGGVYGAERKRLGSRRDGWASTRGLMRGPAAPLLVELMTCLLTVGAWIGALIWA
ncbi:DUF456 domain-containing protein [Streptomyces montanisoli]|uniref:DUF456 domain-containing protein n=1 Tax=Streptomyces montanisoli TaxID=2798581 RepID=A0A940RYZ9_9ACTN|nr:DUF456 domain-containing protein [Streptomyces montanisoli]MBP0461886.1 DUF456 domain-containing protein [Streptomyces montanisoli]